MTAGGPIILSPQIRSIGLAHGHPAITYLLGLQAPSSRETQLRALKRAAGAMGANLSEVPWSELGALEMAALRATLVAAPYSPATCNQVLAAVRGVQRCAMRSGLMSHDDFERAHVLDVRGRRAKPGRSLAASELRQLFRTARDLGGGIGLRLCAILALGYGGGLRRYELTGATLEGYRPGVSVTLLTKGNNERCVPLAPGSSRALETWVDWRGSAPGYLVCGIHRYPKPGRADPSCRMHVTSVYASLCRLAERAEVAHFSPHDLRRTFAGDLLDAGVDLRTVQELMGHADPVTTAGYDRRGARVLAEAVARLDVPHT